MEPTLASPLTLAGVTLKNRLAKSAMSERLAGADLAPNERHERLYRTWSEGGAGLLITGNVMIDAKALGEAGNVAIEDDRHLESMKAWARAATAHGAVALMQLNHPGRQSPRMLSRQPVAPSAVPMRVGGGVFAPPRALTHEEIEALIGRFEKSAAVAKQAGFHGVQLHAAHGYLVSQFLSPHTNRREDAWGGDATRRSRFLLEAVRALRRGIGKDGVLAVKLNSADFQRGGFDEAESLAVVEAIEAEGVELLEISGGTYESSRMFDEQQADSTRAREAFFLDYAEKVRARTRLPLMVTGGFRSLLGMKTALATGAVDVIGLARPLAAEPDLPARLLSGATTQARAITLKTFSRQLDAVVQGAWYQIQLNRLSEGKPPDYGVSRVRALFSYLKGPKVRRSLDASPLASGTEPSKPTP